MIESSISLKRQPKISIIVPVYNVEKYLRECLDSLISQTYTNIEVLCINDGSKDGSYNILNEYAEHYNNILVFSQENAGPAMARNVGLANANGDYLMFCDADDSYTPTMCEDMLKIMESGNYDFVICDTNIIETEKNTRSKAAIDYNRLQFTGEILLDNHLKSEINTLLWNKIFRMDLIRRYDIVFPCGFEMDDDAFIFQYLSVSKKAFGLKKKLYNYRLLSTGIMSNYFTSKNPEKIFDMAYTYGFAVRNIINFNVFQYEYPWIIKRINNKLKWSMGLLTKEKSIHLCKLCKENILNNIDIKYFSLYPLLVHIKKNNFIDSYNTYFGIKVKHHLKFIKIVQTSNKREMYLCGLKFFEKIITKEKTKYYLFGIKYHEKIHFFNDKNSSDLKSYINWQTNYLANSVSRSISTAFLHQKTFGGYKNKYNGRDVVLIGGGPTVNNIEAIPGAVYVGLNRAFLRKDIPFSYLFSCDKIAINNFLPELIEYSKECNVFIGDINCGKNFQIPESVFLKLNASKYKCDNGIRRHKFTVDIETEALGAFHSVAFQAVQFILYTNPKRLYLVGIDCAHTGMHFAGTEHNVAERGEDINNTQAIQIQEWIKFKDFVEEYYPETEIISVNPVGLKGIFTDIYTKNYIEEMNA